MEVWGAYSAPPPPSLNIFKCLSKNPTTTAYPLFYPLHKTESIPTHKKNAQCNIMFHCTRIEERQRRIIRLCIGSSTQKRTLLPIERNQGLREAAKKSYFFSGHSQKGLSPPPLPSSLVAPKIPGFFFELKKSYFVLVAKP